MKIIKDIGPIYTHSLKRRYLFEHNTDHEFADYGTSLGFSRSSDMVDYDSLKGSTELHTPFYVTFVITVGTVAALMLTALTRMIAEDTVVMTTVARSRRFRIC